jgi:hypothetical protein
MVPFSGGHVNHSSWAFRAPASEPQIAFSSIRLDGSISGRGGTRLGGDSAGRWVDFGVG